MPDKPLTRTQLLVDLTIHAGYEVLMKDVFEAIIEEEEHILWTTNKGPQARLIQLEAVTYMKAYLQKAKIKISNTIKDAQAAERNRDVQETQRTGRR